MTDYPHKRERRRRHWECEWCGGSTIETQLPDGSWEIYYGEFPKVRAALGIPMRAPRFGKRFCSASCRQRSFEARHYGVWTIDGEELTGQELVDRGWTITSKPRSGKPNAPRRAVAIPPKR